MTLFKRLFGSRKPDQEMRGEAPQQSSAEQDAVRQRMETEITRAKERRATIAAEDTAGKSTS